MSWKSSKSRHPDPLPETVTVGRVRRPHGVGGQLVVEVLSDVAGRIAAGAQVDLVLSGGDRRRSTIVAAKIDRSIARIRLQGIGSRDEADELRGAWLEIERREVPPAPEGSYYFFELVGCLCCDRRAGELGLVERVIEDGGGLLLEVRGDGRVLLIPFVGAYLSSVDAENRRIDLELPAGLIETCASTS